MSQVFKSGYAEGRYDVKLMLVDFKMVKLETRFVPRRKVRHFCRSITSLEMREVQMLSWVGGEFNFMFRNNI